MDKKVSFLEKLAYGVGDGGCNFVWTTVGSFLTLYYTDSVGISAAVVGTIMLLTRLLDGVSDLGMGVLIDRTRTRWGKARPWILWTALPMAIGLYLLFNVPTTLSYQGKIIYAFITYVIMAAFIYTACNLAYNTLLSLVTPEPKDRISMSSIRFFCTMGVVLIISYNAMKLVERFGWSGMSIIFGIIAALLLLITFFFTKERYEPIENKQREPQSVSKSFKVLFKNKYFVFVTVIFVINYTALTVLNGVRIFFVRDVLGNAGLFGVLTLSLILPRMIGNLFMPNISKIFGKWKCLMVGYVLQIIGMLIIGFMPTTLSGVIWGSIIAGIGGVPHTSGLFALVADVVDYGEWKTGERIDGLTYSATSFGMKVGTGLGSALVGWVLAWGGYNATLGQQGAETLFAITSLYSYIPLSLFVVGIIVMFFTNIDKIYPVIAKDLEKRRAENQQTEACK